MFRFSDKYQEFVRFCIVGVLCTGIDAFIFYMLMPLTGYPVALVSGYILSLVVNYFLTVRWTFKSKANAKNAVGIVAAHLFNLFVVRMGLMYLWVNGCKLPERTAYLPTLAISVVANFIIIKLIIVKLNSHEKSIHTNSLL